MTASGNGARGMNGKASSPPSSGTAAREARRRILGLGFWVQGFRCFPWMGVDFYLQDALKVEPSALQVFYNFTNIPFVGKPFYGFISDFVCVRGEHRLPYIALGVQFAETMDIPESTLDLQKRKKKKTASGEPRSVGMEVREIVRVLRKPEIFFSIIWYATSDAVIPFLARQLFYYHTQHLGLSPSVLSLTKFFSRASLFVWSMAYNRMLRQIPVKKMLCLLQVAIALFILSDALYVMRFYRGIGLPDGFYAVVFSGFQEALFMFKLLPFSVMVARLCPPGCEGSVMAFLTSALALAAIIGGYLGAVLADYFGVSAVDFSGLPKAILVEAACSLLPLLWSSWIPGEERRYVKG